MPSLIAATAIPAELAIDYVKLIVNKTNSTDRNEYLNMIKLNILTAATILMVGSMAMLIFSQSYQLPSDSNKVSVLDFFEVKKNENKNSQNATLKINSTSLNHQKNEIKKNIENQPNESKSKIIEKLIGSGKPEDSLVAFKMLSDCAKKRRSIIKDSLSIEDIDSTTNVTDICGDITDSQLISRFQLGEYAVFLNVKKAATMLLSEGPPEVADISFEAVWSHENYGQWKSKIISILTAAKNNGDNLAIVSLANLSAYPSSNISSELGIQYTAASIKIIKSESLYHKNNPIILNELEKSLNLRIKKYSQSMTDTEIKDLIIKGEKMVN